VRERGKILCHVLRTWLLLSQKETDFSASRQGGIEFSLKKGDVHWKKQTEIVPLNEGESQVPILIGTWQRVFVYESY